MVSINSYEFRESTPAIVTVKMPEYTEEQLLKAVQYSKNNPDIPLTRIAALYEVNLSTL